MPSTPQYTKLITLGICLLICSVFFELFAWCVAPYLPRKYTSRVTFEVKVQRAGITFAMPETMNPIDPDFVADQIQILHGKYILYSVIDELGLVNKWSAGLSSPLTKEEAYHKLSEMMTKVSEVRDSDMMFIEVTSHDRQEAADIANTIAVIFQKKRRDDQELLVNGGLRELKEEVDKQREKLKAAQEELTRIRLRDGIIDLNPDFIEPDSNTMSDDYLKAKKNYIDAKKLLDSAEQRLMTEKAQIKITVSPAEIWDRAEPAKYPSSPDFQLVAKGLSFVCALTGLISIFIGQRLKRLEAASSPI